MSEIGHNSEPVAAFAKEQLRSIIERIERLEEDKAAIASDIKDVYAESKSNGFDVPALRAIIRARREDPDKRRAREDMIDTYNVALGVE